MAGNPLAPDLYQSLGGRTACRKLAVAFYARVARDPLLRPLFPGTTFTCAIEEFSAFLAQFLGGPSADMQRRWWLSLHESHQRFKIGASERNAWMNHMIQAFEDVQIEEPLRSALLSFFKRSSAYVIDLDEDESLAHPEIARRWDAQRTLDEAVAAIRAGDADRAIALAANSTLQSCDRTLFTGLLARMIRGRHPILLDYVREQLARDPSLVQQRYGGRTLLHEAAASGSSAAVEFLLSSGADPNATDGGGHTPLYSLGNGCVMAGGEVVHSLVRAGANVNVNGGVKNCTALHMAARRDNVDVARALLECGADIEARDSLGETPLRRAVNCNQVGVAALLISKGADVHSPGSKGRTPKAAARSSAMKRLFEAAQIR